MLLFFVTPGFKQAPSDAHLVTRKNELDQQAVATVASNQGLYNNLPINQSDRVAMADAARRGDRQAFDQLMNKLAPLVQGNARDVMYNNLRGNVLAEQQILYRTEYSTAVGNGDSQAMRYWLTQSIKNAREYAPYGTGMTGFPLTEDESMRMALEALGNTLSTVQQKESMLVDAIESGASAASVFGAARDLGIAGNSSSTGSGTVMQRLYSAAIDRATRLFNEMRTYYGQTDPIGTMEFNRRLHEFTNLLGPGAIPNQNILNASDAERQAFLDNIRQQLKTQAGLP